VVEANEETTKAVRNAPAILGAVILGIGIVLAIVIAIVFRDISAKSDALVAVMNNQAEQIEALEGSLKRVAQFEEVLKKYEKIADDTTQRAMVVLREQTKADRAAMIDLESRRLKEILGTAREDAAARPAAAKAEEAARAAVIERTIAKANEAQSANLDKAIARLDARINELMVAVKGIKPPATAAGSNRAAALTDAQARELKKTAEDVATLRKEMSELRSLLEKKSPELQGGVPAFRKQTSN
jgi:transcriptional regulator of heat shock response